MKQYVIWFTGLSGSGKSTLASGVEKVLSKKYKVVIIDGDEFRKKVHANLGFSKREIILNNQKIIDYCLHNLSKYDFILVPVIAPFEKTREFARKKLKQHYLEVFTKASLDTCIKRDTKGLYKKALAGEIENFIGIAAQVPYETPANANIVIDTHKLSKKISTNRVLHFLRKNKIYES